MGFIAIILELLALVVATIMIREILNADVPPARKYPWIAIVGLLAVIGLFAFYSLYFVIFAFAGILAYYFIGRPKMMG